MAKWPGQPSQNQNKNKSFARKRGYLGDCVREFREGKSLRRDRATTNWDQLGRHANIIELIGHAP